MFTRRLACFGACIVAGCALLGQNRISYVVIDPGYRINEFAFAGSTGALRAVVIGDPFLVGRERFGKVVSEAMYGHHFGPVVEFTTDPEAEVTGSYKVVMMFDAPLSAGEATVCKTSPSAEPTAAVTSAESAPDRPVYVVAAFCRGPQALTHLAGVMARTGIDDPVFLDFVAQMTLRLFPANNPENRPDHERENDNDLLLG